MEKVSGNVEGFGRSFEQNCSRQQYLHNNSTRNLFRLELGNERIEKCALFIRKSKDEEAEREEVEEEEEDV